MSKIKIIFLYLCLYLCIELCFGNRVDVKTSSGVVRGQTIQVLNTSIDQFLNIPYAEPPIGELRFDKPKAILKPRKVSFNMKFLSRIIFIIINCILIRVLSMGQKRVFLAFKSSPYILMSVKTVWY